MGVFGDGYDVASDVVLILSLTMLLATACGPVDSVLLMAGRSWLSLRNSTVALAVNVGLNVVLIPLDGIRGAAIAWSVAIVVRNLLPAGPGAPTPRRCGRSPDPRCWSRSGAVACFGVVGRRRRRRRPPRRRRRGAARASARWSTWPASGPGARRSGSRRSASALRRRPAPAPGAPGDARRPVALP